jgi:hypothetical protein
MNRNGIHLAALTGRRRLASSVSRDAHDGSGVEPDEVVFIGQEGGKKRCAHQQVVAVEGLHHDDAVDGRDVLSWQAGGQLAVECLILHSHFFSQGSKIQSRCLWLSVSGREVTITGGDRR